MSDAYIVLHESEARKRKAPGYDDPPSPWARDDNHWALFRAIDGQPVELVFSDHMEPEDALLVRDLRPLVKELNELAADREAMREAVVDCMAAMDSGPACAEEVWPETWAKAKAALEPSR